MCWASAGSIALELTGARARWILSSVDHTSSAADFLPYCDRWELADANRYFAPPPMQPSVSLQSERVDGVLRWSEVTFSADVGVEGVATVVSPASGPAVRGVVLAHGGSDDGRRFFTSEAADLAAQGAAVILPATQVSVENGIDAFAADVRRAVLIERAALDVLVDWAAAPSGGLSFLGHSGGGAIGAVLSAVEPRLARTAIFGYGAGYLARTFSALELARGRRLTSELAAAADWFDPARFVGVARRAHLLVQHGRLDQSVPIADGRAMYEAAASPKFWAEYDWGHGLDADPQARHDRLQFVAHQ